MTDGNVSVLLDRLQRYAEALNQHNVAVTRAYENALESLSRLRQVYAGAAAEDFMSHWDRTTEALNQYVEGSRRLSEILEGRISTLREADRPNLNAGSRPLSRTRGPGHVGGARTSHDLGVDPATGLDHMTTADFVPVDVSRFTEPQRAQVRQFLGRLGPAVFMVGE